MHLKEILPDVWFFLIHRSILIFWKNEGIRRNYIFRAGNRNCTYFLIEEKTFEITIHILFIPEYILIRPEARGEITVWSMLFR